MSEALQELKAISMMYPQMEKEINRWICQYIKESHFMVQVHRAGDKEHAKYAIENAKHQLGKKIADDSNMYPNWTTDGSRGAQLRISAIYFTDEYGK